MKRIRRPSKKKFKRRRWTKRDIARWRRDAFLPRYSVECHYDGFNPSIDRALSKLVGRQFDGSGMSFVTGMRDIEFGFKTEAQAMRAVRRIRKAKIRGVKIMMRGYWKP